MHIDKNTHGQSWTIGLGDYKGSFLWVLDQAHGNTPMVVAKGTPGHRPYSADWQGGAARYVVGIPGHKREALARRALLGLAAPVDRRSPIGGCGSELAGANRAASQPSRRIRLTSRNHSS